MNTEYQSKPAEPLILPKLERKPFGTKRVVLRFALEMEFDINTPSEMLAEETARNKAFLKFKKMSPGDLDAYYNGCTVDGKEL